MRWTLLFLLGICNAYSGELGLHLAWDANPEKVDGYLIYMAPLNDEPANMQKVFDTTETALDFKPVECTVLNITTPERYCFRLKAYVYCDLKAAGCDGPTAKNNECCKNQGIITSDFSEAACIDLKKEDMSGRGLPCAPARPDFVIR